MTIVKPFNKFNIRLLYIIITFTVCIPFSAWSKLYPDSLKNIFHQKSPHEKCKWLIEQGYEHFNKNVELTYLLNKYADKLCDIYLKNYPEDSLSLLEQKGNALNNLGFLNLNKGKIHEALEYYFNSLKIRESISDYTGMAISYNSIGSIYSNQGDFEKAKAYFEKSLAM